MTRRPVQGHKLYSEHELVSRVVTPLEEWGCDPTTGAVERVLNAGQGVASPRALTTGSLGPTLDIDTSFVFENGENNRCKHIRVLQTGIAIRCRMLPKVAHCFKIGNEDYNNVLDRVGVNFKRKNDNIMSLSRAYIKGDAKDESDGHLKDFDRITIESTRAKFQQDLARIKSSRRYSLGSKIEDHIRSEYDRIQRLEVLHQTAKEVVGAIKELHSSVAAGQTPDLITVERILHTPQNYDEMPKLLCETAFHGMVDPTRVFLDYTAHAEMLQVAMFLGQANLGIVAPTKRQSIAFLREIMGEESKEILPFHVSMRTLLSNQIEAICDWRPHREALARICREVIGGARPEGVVERRQLWKIH